MIPIKVNGRGLIPRGHGIAPKSLVKADMQLVQLILGTPGLSMEFVNPETGTLTPITRTNYIEIFESYESRKKVEVKTENKAPEVKKEMPKVEPKVEPKIEHKMEMPKVGPKVEVKEEVKVEPKVEPKVENKVEAKAENKSDNKDFSFKPVHKEDKK